jgi:hypothetical protein
MGASEAMKLTDWRGAEYGAGDTILYPRMSGRSCEIAEATVVDIWQAYYDFDTYKWKRVAEGGELPMVRRHIVFSDPPEFEEVPVDAVTRVKVQPNGRGSRDFSRSDYSYVKNAEGEYERVETGIKPVTLNIIDNITVIAHA